MRSPCGPDPTFVELDAYGHPSYGFHPDRGCRSGGRLCPVSLQSCDRSRRPRIAPLLDRSDACRCGGRSGRRASPAAPPRSIRSPAPHRAPEAARWAPGTGSAAGLRAGENHPTSPAQPPGPDQTRHCVDLRGPNLAQRRCRHAGRRHPYFPRRGCRPASPPRDFVRLPLVASLDWKLRQTLNDLDRNLPTRWTSLMSTPG